MTDELVYCEWPRCELEGTIHIEYDKESIRVCNIHRGAVVVNIETSGKIWIFKNEENERLRREQEITRPKHDHIRTVKQPIERPKTQEDWEREAAKQADAAAVPVNPIPDQVVPRRRELADEGLSRILGNLSK